MTPESPPNKEKPQKHAPETCSRLTLIGDGLHILNPSFHDAILKRQPENIARFAQKRVTAGAHALAVNLGPGKNMFKPMPWIIDTLRSATEVPLFFSSGILRGEKTLQQHGADIIINAVTANPETLHEQMAVAATHGAGLVVLLVRPDLTPAGLNERIHLALDVLETAAKADLPSDRLYLDPILSCRPDPYAISVSRGLPDIGSIIETITFIRELDKSVQTILGLGNGSVGLAATKRSALHCRMLPLLAASGLNAAIMNCLDSNLMNVARNLDSATLAQPNALNQFMLAPAA